MLTDLWPLFGLTVTTERLQLRLPREQELAALAELAGAGVHHPHERPFLTPWTDGTPADRARAVLQGHWHALASWRADAWGLRLGVFHDDQPLGLVNLGARDFAVVREVTTWSWLGLAYQGKGFGTEARAGLLTLAFDHLGATAARSEVFRDNHASQAVSRKLGYERDGISVDARQGEALVSDRLRLTAAGWRSRPRPAAAVTGLDACRSWFIP
ncbi:GNAT family N-acetyltransferase [Symbioplanes lichenis]|uniref:GNAT family N-acetyltransferase n=1 Tax=Symbioplanes lichenis TaxID=1629072 RepID=UPI0027391240|nr:GNAT family N-acetyltransferase [Actinoplanes lichenis]